MTAPDLLTWTVAPDADGDETLWYGDTAVLRRCDIPALHLSGRSYDLLWDVLTRVLAPDEATVERLAMAMHDRLRWASMHWSTQHLDREAAPHLVTAMLATLAGTSAQARHTADDTAGGGEHG